MLSIIMNSAQTSSWSLRSRLTT